MPLNLAYDVDTSGFNDGSLHLIVRYWTLREQAQVRRTNTRAVVAIKVACIRADIKIPQPVLVTLYDRTIYREGVLNFEWGEGESGRVGELEKSSCFTLDFFPQHPSVNSVKSRILGVAELSSDIKSALRQSGVKSSQHPALNHHSVWRPLLQQSTVNSQQSTLNNSGGVQPELI
ncbi:hypothetical protein [Microcoleus sp. D2_18a_D3]|uniref:hypothetical protein n=1 Tax=Microcoleus sp. D2_18a_D3 TaxID=3055330 RepID=UPI002FD0AFE8